MAAASLKQPVYKILRPEHKIPSHGVSHGVLQ
jgi:hypothetical protein